MAIDDDVLIVEGDDALTIDQRLDAALSGLTPSADPDTQQPLGRGWAFDFGQGEFVLHGTAPARVSDAAHLSVWVEKTLRTARYAHDIYDDDYGVDEPWVGIGVPATPAIASRIARNITDALVVHDRITAVSDFTFQGLGTSQLSVGFRVVTDEPGETLDFTAPFGVNG